MDAAALKASWTQVAELGDQVAAYFYATLFSLDPQLRNLFAPSMGSQRDRLLAALGHIVSHVDDTDTLVAFVRQLGRDHRRFEVKAEHYPTVGRALLHTLAHGLGPAWTDQLEADWTEAYGVISSLMIEAAQAAADVEPPWWNAEIVAHEQRTADVAVLTVRPDRELSYRAGQSVAIESHLRPRVWRYLTPANARRPDGTIEFHVRAVAGGQVSSALVYQARPGDVLRLGAPIGTRLTVTPRSHEDLLLLAGGTGLAPMKAIVEELASNLDDRRVTLVAGAATSWDLYDLRALRQLAEELRWLQVVPTVSDDPLAPQRATAVEAALAMGSWHDRLIYVCGSPAMVSGTCQTLLDHGYSPGSVRTEQFDGETYAALPRVPLGSQRTPHEETTQR